MMGGMDSNKTPWQEKASTTVEASLNDGQYQYTYWSKQNVFHYLA